MQEGETQNLVLDLRVPDKERQSALDILNEGESTWMQWLKEPALNSEEWGAFQTKMRPWMKKVGLEQATQEDFLVGVTSQLRRYNNVVDAKRLMAGYVDNVIDINVDIELAEDVLRDIDVMTREGGARSILALLMARVHQDDEVRKLEYEELSEAIFKTKALVVEADFGQFKQAIEDHVLYQDFIDTLDAQESTLRLLHSKLTGDTVGMRQFMLDRLSLSEFDSEDGFELVIHPKDGVVELRSSMLQLFGVDSVAGEYFSLQSGTVDTPLSFYIPVTDEETKLLLSKNQNWRREMMVSLLRDATGIVGMGHGFGATREVWRPYVKKLSGFDESLPGLWHDRRVGFAITSKGMEDTAKVKAKDGKVKVESGDMDKAAWQANSVISGIGLVGNEQAADLVWLGHSKGGQESGWAAVYGEVDWRYKEVMLNPVLNNSKSHLKIFYGNLAGFLTTANIAVPRAVRSVWKDAGDFTSAVAGFVGRAKLRGSSLRDQVLEALIENKPHEIGVHMSQLDNTEAMEGDYDGLKNSEDVGERLFPLLASLYRSKIGAVVVGTEDNVLGYDDKEHEVLRKHLSDWLYITTAGHYIFSEQVGGVLVASIVDRCFDVLRDERVALSTS